MHARNDTGRQRVPGFGPFVRPKTRLGEEHTTWRGEVFRKGDAVFLEIAGAYRKYQAPMGRLIYVGEAPEDTERSAQLAIDGMKAICDVLKPGVLSVQDGSPAIALDQGGNWFSCQFHPESGKVSWDIYCGELESNYSSNYSTDHHGQQLLENFFLLSSIKGGGSQI